MSLPVAEEKAVVVEAMFDRIASSYDRMNRVMTLGLDRRWRRRTLALAQIAPGQSVLDLGCGTGDLCEDLAAAGAHAIGIDPSAGMLSVAADRRVPAKLLRGDGLKLPFADGTFDRVVSGFVLRNLAELATGLNEAARVLKPGGCFAVLEVSVPENIVLRTGHGFYFGRVVPLLGRLLVEEEAYSYLPQSASYLPAWPDLRALLEEAGFVRFDRKTAMGGAVQMFAAWREA